MATKVSSATLSKSDAVREYLAAHRTAPVKQVASALADEGIEVSVALINKIKYAGRKSLRSRRMAGRKPPLRKATARPASKAQAIRRALTQLGRATRPRDVVAHLKQGGVEVSAAQVSAVRKRFRGTRPRPAAAALAGGRTGDGISLEHLMAAKRLADQVGLDAAQRALEVLARLAS
jgi:hypothetical protein